MKKKEAKFIHGALSIVLLALIMFVTVVVLGIDPQLPLVAGCVIASLVAGTMGYGWDDILESMLKGITQSLEAILILMSIGILVSVWIASGTVPTMIYYGLMLVSPQLFLLATFLLCSIISMFVGSWGAAGTVGIAFMGIGQALGVTPAVIAGTIVAGSYVGDKLSPFSDGTNLAAAVAKASVFDTIKQMLTIAPWVWGVSAVTYVVLGLQYRSIDAAQIDANLRPLMDNLQNSFYIGIPALLPLAVMLVCVAFKMPSLPAILTGALVGGVQASIMQGCHPATLLQYATTGHVSQTGSAMLDELLTAGGMESMMRTISIILIAMAFGGIMQGTGQMAALVDPVVSRVRSIVGIFTLTIATCIGINILLPDQYLGIAVSGQMYAEEYEKREIDHPTLANVLGSGAAVTSPLVPWNTCGVYMATILGVSAIEYAPYAVFNYLMPIAMIIYGFLLGRKRLAAGERQVSSNLQSHR